MVPGSPREDTSISNNTALTPGELRQPDVLWATFLGVGFIPPAPGTWGSLAAAVVWWFFLSPLPALWQLWICGGYFLLSWLASHRICRRYGVDDAPQIVADEVVGVWLGLLLLPKTLWVAICALIIFRILDILKPSFIGWLDRHIKGGLGVMLDDVMAGMVTGLLMWGIVTWLPLF